MARKIGWIGFGCLLVALGLVSGWYAGRQGVRAAGETEAEADAAPTGLPEQTLKNLGVTVGEAEAVDFVRSAKVQATVVDAPLNTQPLVAPLGGIVTELHVRSGQTVAPGEVVAVIAREAIPRPALALTADLLTPVSEGLHEAVSNLRSAASQLEIVQKELERIRAFTREAGADDLPVIPRKTEIDLEYDLARARQAMTTARRELEWHGLNAAEIDGVLEGALPPGNQRLWKRALEQNGLWGEQEEAILRMLPERAQDLPWSVAAIGELSAAGLTGEEFANALRETPHLTTHFVEVASLLLEGTSIGKVRLLCEHGAFEPMMKLRAPNGEVEDWDVTEISVRVGQRLEAGDAVVVLHDARTMWLRLEPAGEELGHVASALESGAALRASPLLAGTGPMLEDLRVDRLESRGAQEERGSAAYVTCRNESIVSESGMRSWRLRVGLRYLVEVPVELLEGRFVLPAEAVTSDGPNRIVFIQNGAVFRPQPVHVEYEDDKIAVIANDGSIFDGDPVVTTGAFALGLALQTQSGGASSEGHGHSHAGHSHG